MEPQSPHKWPVAGTFLPPKCVPALGWPAPAKGSGPPLSCAILDSCGCSLSAQGSSLGGPGSARPSPPWVSSSQGRAEGLSVPHHPPSYSQDTPGSAVPTVRQ